MARSGRLTAVGGRGPQVLSEDGERVFCRELRVGRDGRLASYLVVRAATKLPSSSYGGRLAHEWELREALDADWALRPLELQDKDGLASLVLEDPGGDPLEHQLGAPMQIGRFLRMAISLASAICKLHERGIVHKDIKPANILVDAAGAVRLTGFGIASRLTREKQSPEPPGTIAGTLAYMAPEQTGRVSRSIDSRSDLYALGVTYYQMLTGILPFTASNPLEWVHCHVARRPIPPAERVPDVPGVISAIVMRLLAKNAEDRYQTASGLERDLRRCLTAWEANHRFKDFPLGEHDMPDRLVIYERLYGREREVDALFAAIDRIAKGGPTELVLVSGYAGIGKSSIVNELQKAVASSGGFFAAGKFDQHKRDVPYSTLALAFQGLVRSLLAGAEADLTAWREALLTALGPNGRLIADLVPDLSLIIGDQPPVPELALQQAQRRFQLAFSRFIGVFARPEHPLALFLDDLQWSDAATLDLLEALLNQSDLRHLLVVVAYRDNEVDVSHPLTPKIAAIRKAARSVLEVRLAPLAQDDVHRLLATALHCESARALPLAQLLHKKTGGNPFFLIQFLHALAEEGLLSFDYRRARWSWDLQAIHAKGYTDNVADLLVERLDRLPGPTQAALQQLACLGSSAEISTLSIVLGASKAALDRDLREAVRQEVVERRGSSYRLVHDRVQEAAYGRIPESSRPGTHLRIGRLLAAHTSQEHLEEAIFDIVGQLNRGAALITARLEREQLAHFNLIAGNRAKSSTAYVSALTYFVSGAALLRDDCWELQHDLAFALELGRAECEFLTGARFAAADRLAALSTRAEGALQIAAVACLRMETCMLLFELQQAVDVGLGALNLLGIDWSPHPSEEGVRLEYERIMTMFAGRKDEDFLHLPTMNDLASRHTLNIISGVLTAARYHDANLYVLAVCKAVDISLQSGNGESSHLAFISLGVVAAARFEDYDAALRLCAVGYELIEQWGSPRLQWVSLVGYHSILMWLGRFQDASDLVRRAADRSENSNAVSFVRSIGIRVNLDRLAAGAPLAELQRDIEILANITEYAVSDKSLNGFIKNICSASPAFGSLSFEDLDEDSIDRQISQDRLFQNAHFPYPGVYFILKAQARFHAGDYNSAIQAVDQALPRLSLLHLHLHLQSAECHFYGALARAAVWDESASAERRRQRDAIEAHYDRLRVWGESCPVNFESRATLVAAEIARIEARDLEAMRLYKHAIESARAYGLVQIEALAYELASRFYAARGFDDFARLYLNNARHSYARWGADGKVRQLEDANPHASIDEDAPNPTSTMGASVELLDLATVTTLSNAVSGEIVFEKLMGTLLRTAIEQAGAERGLLILQRGKALQIAAEATTDGETIVVHVGDQEASEDLFPLSVLRYAMRSRDLVMVGDAVGQFPFAADSYIQARKPNSALCLPMLNQAKLAGFLYLENKLAPAIFTRSQLSVLKLLASQAAIALENARLYQEIKTREATILAVQTDLARANRLATMGQLTASIAHEVNQPLAATVNNANAALRWLRKQPPDLDETREALEAIVQGAERASEIITHIRGMVRKTPVEVGDVFLNDEILAVLTIADGEASKHGISVLTDLAPNLPIVRGDRVQLKQVLLNLVVNAIEAMSTLSGGVGELMVSCKPHGDCGVVVFVRDTGPGLATEDLERIFQPFHTTKDAGLGMGLAICVSIIEAHGGRLWASPNTPHGAVFQFTLPAERAS